MSNNGQHISCQECGKDVYRALSQIGKLTFCTQECFFTHQRKSKKNNANYKGGKDIPCELCGTMVYRSPCKLGDKRCFCSKACRGKWHSAYLIGHRASNFKDALNTYTCKRCDREFTSYHKNRVFCSLECKQAPKPKVDKTCENCGKSYAVYQSADKWAKIRDNRRTFCSKACLNEGNTGEGNVHWIADREQLKDRKKSLRACAEMREWREKVFERDRFTCQLCTNRSGPGLSVTLNAHHIIPVRDNSETVFDLSNGITLCEACHKLTYLKEEQFSPMFVELVNEKTWQVNLKETSTEHLSTVSTEETSFVADTAKTETAFIPTT